MDILGNVQDRKGFRDPLDSKSCNGEAICHTTDAVDVVGNLWTKCGPALAMVFRKAKVLWWLTSIAITQWCGPFKGTGTTLPWQLPRPHYFWIA